MNKARITSQEAMNDDQVREDITMTPLERLNLAFQLSDFALELRATQKSDMEGSSAIHWIELRKISG